MGGTHQRHAQHILTQIEPAIIFPRPTLGIRYYMKSCVISKQRNRVNVNIYFEVCIKKQQEIIVFSLFCYPPTDGEKHSHVVFHTCRASISRNCFPNPALAGVSFGFRGGGRASCPCRRSPLLATQGKNSNQCRDGPFMHHALTLTCRHRCRNMELQGKATRALLPRSSTTCTPSSSSSNTDVSLPSCITSHSALTPTAARTDLCYRLPLIYTSKY